MASAGWLSAPLLAELPWLWHGFSTRVGGVSKVYVADGSGDSGGELNLGFTAADAAENVRENRLRLVEGVTGSLATPLATVRQVHSDRTERVGRAEVGAACEADGLTTNQAGILLGVQTADCIPVLVADPERRAVAAFHAGWRGTVQGIVEAGVARMRAEFGSEPGDLVAAIGPGIGVCCYSVGEQVRTQFGERFGYAGELFRPGPTGALHLDLVEANRRQLMAAGLGVGAIDRLELCTSCRQDLFYSHRASGGHAGRMMSVIGIR